MVEKSKRQELMRTLARWLWWTVFIFSVTLTLASLPGYLQQIERYEHSREFAAIQQAASWLGVLLSVGAAILCLALALLVYLKRSGEAMAVFLSVYLMSYAVFMVGPLEYFLSYWSPRSVELALLLQGILFSPVASLLILIFPNGRFVPRWTRWLVVFSCLLTLVLLFTFTAGEWVRMTTTRAQVAFVFLSAFPLFSMGVQFYRYRRVYSLVERQQTKWVLIGIVATFLISLFSAAPYYYLLNLPAGTPDPWWEPLVSAMWWFTMMILPVTFTIAILRFRLFDIDVIIRRTLVYGALTATLVMVYFAVVVLMQGLFEAVTGHQSAIAIVISTLGIAALFNPLRKRIQKDIDRRFYRKKYDAEKTLQAFALAARDETNLDSLTVELLRVVEETMQPDSLSLWLRERAK